MFSSDPEFNSYINSQNLAWTSEPVFDNPPTFKGIQQYLSEVTSFYNSAYSNQLFIKNQKKETKLYWLAYVLSEDALRIVPAADKVKVLDLIAKGTIKGETSILTFDVNEEAFVIKIANSITTGQEHDFLLGLINVRSFEASRTITLFQSLYDKVNDAGVGNSNLKLLMDKLYQIWLKSPYNPYVTINEVNDNLVNPTIYGNSPIELSYDSGTILGAFNYSNYDFNFNAGRINVSREDFVSTGTVTHASPTLIGTYGLYQTVAIRNTDSNTGGTKFLTKDPNSEDKASLPIFYLKYIDDKKDIENIKTSAEIAFDIATTFIGVGNLRHLRHINKLGRYALLLDTAPPGTVLLALKFTQGVASLIEISASLGSILINYTVNYQQTYCQVGSPTYDQEKCEFYTLLDDLFLALQLVIASGFVDRVAEGQLRRASQRILSKPIPNDFDPDALRLLRDLAGDFDQFMLAFRDRLYNKYGTYNSPIWQKVNGASITKRDEFLLDFGNAPDDVLDALNANNGDLVDYWMQVEFLKGERSKINFLSKFKNLINDIYLNDHIFKGHRKSFPADMPGQYKYDVTGLHSRTKIGPNDAEITNEVPPSTGNNFYEADVKVWVPTPHNLFIRKSGKKSTFFPDQWDDNRIIQEIAFAYENKQKLNGDRLWGTFEGVFSEGTRCAIHIKYVNGVEVLESVYPLIK